MRLSAAFECWVCVFLWLRKAAIQMLRTLARAYIEHQWCLKYWLWAEQHPFQLEAHHLCSFSFTTQWPIAIHRRSQARLNSSLLAREDDELIASIGVVHGALMALNDALGGMAATFAHSAGAEGGAFEGSASATPLPEGVAHGGSGRADSPAAHHNASVAAAAAEGDEDEEAKALYEYDEMAFQSIAVRFLRAINAAKACAVVPAAVSSPPAAPSTEASPPLVFCWSSLLHDLSAATARCDAFVEAHRARLRQSVYPPAGRSWLRVLAAGCIVAPIAYGAAWKLRTEEFPALYQQVSEAAAAYLQTWVWIPTKAVFRSLSHVRPDAEQQRAYLEAETELTAKVVSDFIREHHPNTTPAELHRIEEAARSGDLSAIHAEHAEAVKRPIYSFFFGPLVQLMLIQLQQQKMAVTGVLISTDEVLESNDFNFKMLALAPVVLGAWAAVSAFARYRSRKKKPIYNRLKGCWRELCRLIERSEAAFGFGGEGGFGGYGSLYGGGGASTVSASRTLPYAYAYGGAGSGGGASHYASVAATPTMAPHSAVGGRQLYSPVLTEATAVPPRGRKGSDSDDDIVQTAAHHRRYPPLPPPLSSASGTQRAGFVPPAGSLAPSQDLSPVDQGRALLIIHEMRGLCERIPEYPLLPQFLEDLADFEATNNSRAKRLCCLNRMMHTHPILHPTFMPMLK